MRTLGLKVAFLAVASLSLWGCGTSGEPADGADPGVVWTNAEAEAELESIQLAATEPTVTLTSPSLVFSSVSAGDPLSVTFSVANATLGVGDHAVTIYLDGVAVGTSTGAAVNIASVPLGQRHLAARLVNQATGVPLTNDGSKDEAYLRATQGCAADADCDDGLACSKDRCVSGSCRWGLIGGILSTCCDNTQECSVNWSCAGGECLQCSVDADCDDDDPCTTGSCAGNSCAFTEIANCCAADGDCDDGDLCTTDSCSGNSCVAVPNGDPLCCNTSADCQAVNPDPCGNAVCYIRTTGGISQSRCRFGPAPVGCCTTDANCDDSNPCTDDVCDISGPTGTCASTDNGDPACCLIHADCGDADPTTTDRCTNNVCVNTPDPNACILPATSDVVLHEIMATPRGLNDAQAEFIELYNATGNTIELADYTLVVNGTSYALAGGFTNTSANGSRIFPGSFFVLANGASSVNGGFTPSWIGGFELPDPINDPDPTTTIELRDGGAALVDTVTYDGGWPFLDGHAIELKHPHLDNDAASAWQASGTSAHLAQNRRYGSLVHNLWGSPRVRNLSSEVLIADASCAVPAGANSCLFGGCDVKSRCDTELTEGCCETNVDCADSDSCTLDECDTGTGLCKPPQADPLCCETNIDCDDANPCNVDRCVGGSCRYSSNIVANCCVENTDCDDDDLCTLDVCNIATHTCQAPLPVDPGGGLTCCNGPDDCDDANPATTNGCSPATNTCTFVANPEYCDNAGAACSDFNPCTDDSCNILTSACVHAPVANCCTSNADCAGDGDACTAEVCDVVSGVCSSQAIAGCCSADAECDDSNVCTTDTCTGSNVCHNTAIGGCCVGAGDCDDSVACTDDSCIDNACVHAPTNGCCTGGANQTQLLAECGAGTDGPATCYQWLCTAGLCEEIVNPACCAVDADCNDGDDCTYDICLPDLTCKHVFVGAAGCCDEDGDCPEADGDVCTSPKCDNSLCTEVAIGGCTTPVPVTYDPDDTWAATGGSCWMFGPFVALAAGDAGIFDCAASGGTLEGLVSTPIGFDPVGNDPVTVEWHESYNGGVGQIELLKPDDEVEIASYDLPTEVGTRRQHALLPNGLLPLSNISLGWRLTSASPALVDYAFANVVVAAGHAPYFVSQRNSNKTYVRSDHELTTNPIYRVDLDTVKKHVLWAHDGDAADTLSFSLVGAPSFVTIEQVFNQSLQYGVYELQLHIAPNLSADVGSFDFKVEVSDGTFTEDFDVSVLVRLGIGHAVLSPPDVDASFGLAIEAALNAAGENVQLVSDLDAIDDPDLLKALWITTGDSADGYDLPDLSAHLNPQTPIYLEGATVFVAGPQSVQKGFRVQPGADLSVVAPLEGTSLARDRDLTWAGAGDLVRIRPEPKNLDARTFLRANGDAVGGLAVASTSADWGAPSVASVATVRDLGDGASSVDAYVADIVAFFQGIYPGCLGSTDCADGDPCTTDSCVAGQCKYSPKGVCPSCQFDSDCAAGQSCGGGGVCAVGTGDAFVASGLPVAVNTTSTNEIRRVQVALTGGGKLDEVRVSLTLVARDGGDLEGYDVRLLSAPNAWITLESAATGAWHDGDAPGRYSFSYDSSRMPTTGSMDAFVGAPAFRTLVVEVNGFGAAHGADLIDLRVWTVSSPFSCSSDTDCDNDDPCDGAEICNSGTCEPGAAFDCGTSPDPCRVFACDPATAACALGDLALSCEGESGCGAGTFSCGYGDVCVTGDCVNPCVTCDAFYDGTADTPVPDGGCITETLTVSGQDTYVTGAWLNAQGGNDGSSADLTFTLTDPDGLSHPLEGSAGGPGYLYMDFWEAEVTTAPGGDPNLCKSLGAPANGDWKLEICDTNEDGLAGALTRWSLILDDGGSNPSLGRTCERAALIPSGDGTLALDGDTTCTHDSASATGCPADGSDYVYKFTLTETKRVTATVLPDTTFDVALHFTTSCGQDSASCANLGGEEQSETIDAQLDPGTHFLLVDAGAVGSSGFFLIDITFDSLLPDGLVCTSSTQCVSGHCDNGFCCSGGDCCADAIACPGSYSSGAACNNAGTCQGTRVDATCVDSVCGSSTIQDDSACDPITVSSTCGAFADAVCEGIEEQSKPSCPTTCAGDDNLCDPDRFCNGNTCFADLTDGDTCDRDAQCINGCGSIKKVCCDTTMNPTCRPQPTAGQLIISEAMQNPAAVNDDKGEWFEVHNPGALPLELEGCTIESANDNPHVIDNGGAGVLIPAGGYVAFVLNGDSATNGGIDNAGYVYADIVLNNSSDSVVIRCAGLVVDLVAYDNGATFPDETGESMTLGAFAFDATANNLGGNWCAAVSAYGSGDLGTPGAANDTCPDPCAGVTCNTPPPNDCDGETARTFAAVGACSLGSCSYATTSTTDCSLTSFVCSQGSCLDPATLGPPPVAGEVVISEVMQNPSTVDDSAGEWFEVHNPTAGDLNIGGCIIASSGDSSHTIDSLAVVVPAGGYVVLGIGSDPVLNGGVPVDYVFSDTVLANGSDVLSLTCDGTLIDSIAWDDGATFPDPTGSSMQLGSFALNITSNDRGGNWCEGTATYGLGDIGTPGAANDVCPDPCAAVTCNAPPADDCLDDVVQQYGAAGTCDGGVCDYPVASTIDCTTTSQECVAGVCVTVAPAPAVGEVIFSEIMQNPTASGDATGEWFELSNTTGVELDLADCTITDNSGTFTIAAGGTLVVPANGFQVFAVSADNGVNGGLPAGTVAWTTINGLANGADFLTLTCGSDTIDTVAWDGGPNFPDPTGASMTLSAAGYNAADNGTGGFWCEATSTYGAGDKGTPGLANDSCPDPCDGVTCNTPPADECVVDTARAYDASGTCVLGVCEYGFTDTDCTLASQVCSVGACQDPVAGAVAPDTRGDVVFTEIMYDPVAVGDSAGEWFEVFNATTDTLELQNCEFTDGEGSFTVSGSLTFAPGERLVFGINGNEATNGGVAVDYDYAGAIAALGNSGDQLEMTCGGVPIDEVDYSAAGFQDPVGASLSLADTLEDPDINDLGVFWAPSIVDWAGTGDLGTPGCANFAATCDQSDPGGGGTGCTKLIISEYIEGSSNNKGVEIYNPTDDAVDLGNYQLWRVSNGGTWPEATLTLSGSLAAGATYTICNASASFAGSCNLLNGIVVWNGDDAVGLALSGVLVDRVGDDGADPGSGWTVNGVSNATADHTLRRTATTAVGTNNWSAAQTSGEWSVEAQDDFTDWNQHTFSGTCN